MQLQRLQDHIHLEVNGLFAQGYGIPILAKRCHSDQCWFTWISNQVLLLHLFFQWEGAKVFQTRYLTFLGRLPVWQGLGESEFFRPIMANLSGMFNLFLLFHSESFWSAKGESELWKQSAAISCNQVARLPNVTDRMLPSSPSCQLQGMLWVNLLLPRTG